MKNPGRIYLGVLASLVLAVTPVVAAEPAPSRGSPAGNGESSVTYEVALINKSMTGDWKDERKFRNYVTELFQVQEILEFKLRGDPLQEWLEKDSPEAAKIICLVDGWVDPEMARVDVRGSLNGKALKLTVKVRDDNWKAALAEARQWVERRQ